MKTRGAVIGVVGILAACTLATANEEPQRENMIEQRQAERRQASAEAAKERILATFYGRVFAAGAESFAGAVFAGHIDLLAAELARQAAERQAAAFAPAPAPRSAPSGGGGTGGGWAALRDCEAGGDYSADTGNGFYGAYQFDSQTWQSVGGSGNPAHASPAEQDARAQQLYAQRGSSPWPSCGRHL